MNQLLNKYKDRYDKRIAQFGGFMLAFGAVMGIMNSRFAYNAINGPFLARGLDLAAIKNPDTVSKYYLLLQGQARVPTGIAWIKVKKGDSTDLSTDNAAGKPLDAAGDSTQVEKPQNVLQVLFIDGYLLPVKTMTPSRDTNIVGSIEALDPKIQTLLFEEAKSEKLQKRILPLMLTESKGFKAIFWVYCLFVGVFVGSGVVKLLQVFALWKDPERHPIGKAIAQAGNYNTTLMDVNDDFLSNGLDLPLSNAIIGKKWLFVLAKKPRVVALRDIVWCYVSSQKQSTNFVAKTNYSAVICISSGEEIGITLPTQGSTALIAAIAQSAPWAYIGFDGKLALRWSAHQREVIAEVQKKCDAMQRKS